MGGPSRIRKSTGVPAPSCTLPGPRIPIEVLLVVSSLSCCNVSRSACKPWRIRSSRLPVTSGSQTRTRTSVSQNGNNRGRNRYVQSAKDSKCFSRYVLALWLRAPIETAKYSNDVPLGENSYKCGPVWSKPTTRKPTPYGRRPYSCVLTWASGVRFARQLLADDPSLSLEGRTSRVCEKNDVLSAMVDTRRFTGTGRLKTILDAMACWRMKLLQARIQREKGSRLSSPAGS